jgi:acyl-CoA thioesterase-1
MASMRKTTSCLLALSILAWWPAPAPTVEANTLLVIGDSLSAGYGIDPRRGWIALLERRLNRRQPPWTVVNASISGETSHGGRARLDALVRDHAPMLCIIELGANDGLRGLPVERLRDNLEAMIRRCVQADAGVLLIGMRLPPNYGRTYTERFRQVYPSLAEKYRIGFVEFLLDGVVQRREWMQADGLHPRAAGQPRLLENVWTELEPLLQQVERRPGK